MDEHETDKVSGQKRCFFIAPIGEESSPVRIRSDQVLRHIVRPAVKEHGYIAERADEIDKPGIITSQVIQRVVGDPLVIADLTGTNPNVFYELAIRHAIKKPLVQIIEKGERIPFDVAGTRTIYVDHKDLDSVAAAKDQISSQIRSLEQDPSDLETPISVSLDLQSLRQSENPEDRELAVVIAELSNIRSSFAKLAENFDERGQSQTHILMRHIDRRLESFIDPARRAFPGTSSIRFGIRIMPELMRELKEFGGEPTRIAMAASLFRDAAPWVYEMGMEAYRQVVSRDQGFASPALGAFREAAHMLMRHPLFRDRMMRSKDGAMLFDFLDELLYRSHITQTSVSVGE